MMTLQASTDVIRRVLLGGATQGDEVTDVLQWITWHQFYVKGAIKKIAFSHKMLRRTFNRDG